MSRQIGNRNENEFMRMAEELGYAAFAARGSRGPVDVLCFADSMQATCGHGKQKREVHFASLGAPGVCQGPFSSDLTPLAVQIGTTAKAVSATLEALDAAPRPIGSKVIVARRWGFRKGLRARVRWTFHTGAGKFDSLKDALA